MRNPEICSAGTRFVRGWETGDFAELVSMLLTQDAVLTMPPWVYWLQGRHAIVATMLSPETWEGEPRPGLYRIVPCGMNGHPTGLAYVRFGNGPYVAVCMTVMTLAPDGRISNIDTFVLPKQFAAWGHLTPPAIHAVSVIGCSRSRSSRDGRRRCVIRNAWAACGWSSWPGLRPS